MMRLNNKAFAISGILYSMLILFLTLLLLILGNLNSRKTLFDRQRDKVLNKLNGDYEKWEYAYTGNYQIFEAPYTGDYQIELWGAQGGSVSNSNCGGKGAYTVGKIKNLTKGTKLYVYVGAHPSYISNSCSTKNKNDSFNGVKIGSCAGGGGATDVRLTTSANWFDFSSTKTRIMVAAGGGGCIYRTPDGIIGYGGYGGDITGGIGYGNNTTSFANNPQAEATQISGGAFGYAGASTTGGGGGYFGGWHEYAYNANGGSSFISGYPGCIAIESTSTEDSIQNKPAGEEQSHHYSGYVFSDSNMIAGNTEMPVHDGNGNMIGNEGDGYAKITYLGNS